MPSSFEELAIDEGVGGQILDWADSDKKIGDWGLPGHGEKKRAVESSKHLDVLMC